MFRTVTELVGQRSRRWLSWQTLMKPVYVKPGAPTATDIGYPSQCRFGNDNLETLAGLLLREC